jgi:hypothetical protein
MLVLSLESVNDKIKRDHAAEGVSIRVYSEKPDAQEYVYRYDNKVVPQE